MSIRSRKGGPVRPKKRREVIWKGLARVAEQQGSDTLGKASGAYVVMMAWASRRGAFRAKVSRALGDLGLKLLRLEEAGIFRGSSRIKYDKIVKRMRNKLRADPQSVQFGTFHTWPA